MIGDILLPRSLMDSEFYLSEKFTKTQAWIDLLLLANSRPTVVSLRGVDITLLSGELAYSITTLAKRWQWDKRTVTKFLDYLSDSKLITYVPQNNLTTIIKIANFERAYVPRVVDTDVPPYYADVTSKRDSFKGSDVPQNLEELEEMGSNDTLQVKNDELSTMSHAPQNNPLDTTKSGKKTGVDVPRVLDGYVPSTNGVDTTKGAENEGVNALQNTPESYPHVPQNYGVSKGQSGKKNKVNVHGASQLAYIYTFENLKNDGRDLSDSNTDKIPAFKGKSKPDDIPDEIWDKAFQIAIARNNVKSPVKLAEIIARQDLMPQYERQANLQAKAQAKTFDEDKLSDIDRSRLEKMKAKERQQIGGDNR